jgi:hypothetical protein
MPVHFELKHDSERERRTKAELQRIMESYDLAAYSFTEKVVINETAIPHSHPVLTLHTRHLGSDDQLLSAYLHEQLHWYLEANAEQTLKAEGKLREIYPVVPVGYPDGAQDKESTYLHLIDCYLEIQADRELIGSERTDRVISSIDHYLWVYRTIIKDEGKIAAIVRSSGLNLPSRPHARS